MEEIGQEQMVDGLETGQGPTDEEEEEQEDEELVGDEMRQKRRFRGKTLRSNPKKILMAETEQLYPSLGKSLSPYWLPTSSMGARGKKSILGDWTRISKRDNSNNMNKRDWNRISKKENSKRNKRDWTRISKRGRETEGSWHPYKRDPIYRCCGVWQGN